MTQANIQARNAFTRRLRGQLEPTPTEKSFGHVYREPGMPDMEDCRAWLILLKNKFGETGCTDALARFGSTSLGTLWVGSYQLFCEFVEACLEYDVPPEASWNGGVYTNDPYVPMKLLKEEL